VHIAFASGNAFYFVIQTAYHLYDFLNLKQFVLQLASLYGIQMLSLLELIKSNILVCWELIYFGHSEGCSHDSNLCCLNWHALKAVAFFPFLLSLLLIFMQCCIVIGYRAVIIPMEVKCTMSSTYKFNI
jgi:hypothetical protein